MRAKSNNRKIVIIAQMLTLSDVVVAAQAPYYFILFSSKATHIHLVLLLNTFPDQSTVETFQFPRRQLQTTQFSITRLT